MNKYNPTGAEPVPDALLIYAAQNGTYLPSNENVQFNGNLTIPFEAGKTYRLRVLNTGVFAMSFFWIDGHEMQVIEADGVRPYLTALVLFDAEELALTVDAAPAD